MTLRRALVALVAVVASAFPSVAPASGFLFGDNGARALQLGGAFAGQADDLTAIQHNPAGLAQQQGFSFLVDAFALNHDISFLRKDADGKVISDPVTNTGGVFLLPFAAIGYGMPLAERRFTLAIGVYGPPSVGRYTFPEPNYEKASKDGRPETYVKDPRRYAPQRYGLIKNDIIILYPTLSASYEVHSKVSVGASLQYVYSHLDFHLAATSSLFTPTKQSEEDADFDSVLALSQDGRPSVTGVFGVLVKPVESVQIGVSYRPPVPIHASGKADITLGKIPSQFYDVVGNDAEFSMTLPQELKVGVHVTPIEALGVNVDAVYQGWQSVTEFVLTPKNIQLQPPDPSAEAVVLQPIHIPKKWHHVWSVRGGAQYRFPFGLTARAGVLWEQQASGDERLHIDFLHPTRAFVTGGLEYAIGPVSIVATGAYLPAQTIEITTSEVRQANTDPGTPGSVVGNGTYTTGGWIVGGGIRGTFGGGAGPSSAKRELSPNQGVLTL